MSYLITCNTHKDMEEQEDFLRKLVELIVKLDSQKDFSINKKWKELRVGDKVSTVDEFQVCYFVDVETKKMLSTGSDEDAVDLLYVFKDQPIILTEILTESPVPFKCNSCPMTHYADCKIYFPDLGRSYYSDLKWLKLES